MRKRGEREGAARPGQAMASVVGWAWPCEEGRRMVWIDGRVDGRVDGGRLEAQRSGAVRWHGMDGSPPSRLSASKRHELQ